MLALSTVKKSFAYKYFPQNPFNIYRKAFSVIAASFLEIRRKKFNLQSTKMSRLHGFFFREFTLKTPVKNFVTRQKVRSDEKIIFL